MAQDLVDARDPKTALLERWRQGKLPSTVQPVAAPKPLGPAPASIAQQRVWFLEQYQPGTGAYNLFFCAEARAPLNAEHLRGAVRALAQRHETLRTTFRADGLQPLQLVQNHASLELEVVDLRSLPKDDAWAATMLRMDTAIHQPFDLVQGPLARVLLLRLENRDVLALVVHHLVADGWSLGVAMQELSAIYSALESGSEPRLLPLAMQYREFSLWQSEQLSQQKSTEGLEYWQSQLRELPPLELPTDHPRPPFISWRGDWLAFELPTELSDELRSAAREENATLFMTLLTGIYLVLYKLSGQTDLGVGTAIANRTLPETFGLIGHFINMLVLRTDLQGDPTLRELLGRVRDVSLSAFAQQDVPFEHVVEALRPPRDPSRSVLFQALFVLQPPTPAFEIGAIPLEHIELGTRTARSDLEFHVWDHPAIVGRISYATDLFTRDTAQRTLARLRMALQWVAKHRERRVSDLCLLLEDERALTEQWGKGPEQTFEQEPVHRLIERNARARADAAAVVFETESLSYGALDARANQLARVLSSLGAGPEARVAVCVERSVDMIVAVLGVLKAGAAYVPLDPRHPPERLELIRASAGARLVVTQEGLLHIVGEAANIVCLDRDASRIAREPDTLPQIPFHLDQLAYILYTSGSTGIPKGVAVSHRSLLNLVWAIRERPGLSPGDVQACVASLSFDASVGEIFPVLASGATLVVVGQAELSDGAALIRRLRSNAVNVLQATATTWQLIQDAGGLGDPKLRALCGGEPTSTELAAVLSSAYQSCWNMYGPTETTCWSTATAIERGAPLSVGNALHNTRLYVLDADSQSVAIGSVGELHIGGAGLSRGYAGAPALTASAFVPDPFSTVPGSRLYRSGDLVRYRENGALEFVGRLDHQIKLRGHRIELGEVESCLLAHSSVERAVAMVLGQGIEAQLVGYVLPRPADEQKVVGELQVHLRARLPSYMVPSNFVFLDALPTTPTGKIDRSRLPSPQQAARGAGASEPRTERERELAVLMAKALHVDRIGIDDDFFASGGHSLLAAQFVRDLCARYEIVLLLEQLFAAPTVARLATIVDAELTRKSHLNDETARMKRVVDDLSDDAVNALLGQLLSQSPKETVEHRAPLAR